MSNKNPKKTKELNNAKADVEGFDIHINEFGEVVCSHNMDSINVFLDDNVADKKLPNAPAYDGEQEKGKKKD